MYYVYAYLRKSDGTPYYIGKGIGYRAYDNKHTVPLPKDKSRIVFLESNLTEIGALAIERRMIAWYGRKDLGTGILRNRTDGGEGASGAKRTQETKDRISEAKIGVSTGPCSPDARLKISKSNIGLKRTETQRANISKSKIGKLNPIFGTERDSTTKDKMKAWQQAHKEERAAESRARWANPEYRSMMLSARKK